MQFTPQFLDELRNRVTVSSVVGRRVRLIRKGREFQGLCPFHNEKTPSFTVNDAKGFYHCFGCGAHGDAIRFLTDSVGIGYVDAVTQLAQEVGLPLPKLDKKAEQKAAYAASLYDVMEMACNYYQAVLARPEGRQAREYLHSRGINETLVRGFRLGFAPDHFTALKAALEKQGVTEAQLKAAGLLTEKPGKASYDKFRNRIIFPITDGKHRVIAFGGRVLGEGLPKYLNSPETELFHKGDILYNMAQAKEAAYQTGQLVVAEGYMDVIALHKAGITQAVAPLGTAITESQLALLWRFAKEPVLCLDGDNAGKRAMVRAAMLALPLLKPGYSLAFVLLPKGMDPDDIVRREGAVALKEYLANPLPLSEVLWRLESVKRQVTPEQKAALESRLKAYAAQMKDKTVQAYYYRFFNEKLWQWGRAKKDKPVPIAASELGLNAAKGEVTQIQLCEETLLAFILAWPELLDNPEVEEELCHIHFTSEYLDTLCTAILEVKHSAIAAGKGVLTCQALELALEQHGVLQEWQRIRKSRQGFLGEFLAPGAGLEMVVSGWKYTVLQRNVALMEAERHRALIEVTEESQHRAFELEKHIAALKKLLQMSESV